MARAVLSVTLEGQVTSILPPKGLGGGRGGIADHRATLTDGIIDASGADDIVAGHRPSGDNPGSGSRPKPGDIDYGIATHYPIGGYSSGAGRAGAGNAQSLNDRAVSQRKLYPVTEIRD